VSHSQWVQSGEISRSQYGKSCSQIAQSNRAEQVYWESYPRALLHADGSATIIEPCYDSDTFTAAVAARKAREFSEHLHDKP
jgi:hypothetical protein